MPQRATVRGAATPSRSLVPRRAHHHHGNHTSRLRRTRAAPDPTAKLTLVASFFSAKKDGTGGNTCLRSGRENADESDVAGRRPGPTPIWSVGAHVDGHSQALASWHWHDYTSFWLAVSLHVSSSAGTAGRSFFTCRVQAPTYYTSS